jgi:tetratricopeptide (TPR) repeat protein
VADAAVVLRVLSIAASGVAALGGAVLSSCSEDPAVLAGHLARAKQHLARRQYPPALEAFDEVLALDPKHFDARRLKAEILYNTAKLDAAESILIALQKESAGNLDVVWGLAMIRKDQMRFAAALTLFRSMPVAERPMFPMAETLTGVGRHDEAVNWLGRYLARNPFDSKAYYLLSKIEFRRGRESSGKFWGDFYRGRDRQRREDGQARGMEHAGKPLDAMMFRAQKMCERGRFFEGLRELTRVLQANNAVPMAYYMIGQIMANVGNSAAAITAFDRVLTLNPGEPQVTTMRAAEQKKLATAGGRVLSAVDAAKRFASRAQHDDARNAALFAAQSNSKDLAALRLVVQLFDRREDTFVRLWALEKARGLAPSDATLTTARDAELSSLGMKF